MRANFPHQFKSLCCLIPQVSVSSQWVHPFELKKRAQISIWNRHMGGFNRRPSFYCPASVRDHWALPALQLFLFSTDYRMLCSNTKTQLTLWSWFIEHTHASQLAPFLELETQLFCVFVCNLLDLLLELLLINSFRANPGCCMWTATNGYSLTPKYIPLWTTDQKFLTIWLYFSV